MLYSAAYSDPMALPLLLGLAAPAFQAGRLAAMPSAHYATRMASSSPLMAADPDFDLLIVGCGVGGHGAALHAVSKGLKVAVVAGGDVGGTCVNRGCVPSKALLAASGRVRSMGDEDSLAAMGIKTNGVSYDREKVAAHANNLASKVAKNLGGSLSALGIETFMEKGQMVSPTEVSLVGSGKTVTAKNVILATGSVPFVPPGVETDGKTVFTSDEALKLEWVPDYIAIIGSGYIGLEFSDVYTALGSEVTFIEAMPRVMFFFDKQIAQLAERLLIRPRAIDYRTNVFASKVTPGIPGVKPVTIEMIDAKTKEHVETLEVDACMVCTGRAPYSEGLGLENTGAEVRAPHRPPAPLPNHDEGRPIGRSRPDRHGPFPLPPWSPLPSRELPLAHLRPSSPILAHRCATAAARPPLRAHPPTRRASPSADR